MNNKGLSCSTVILFITMTCQGCSHFGDQISKVKSAFPGKDQQSEILLAARTFESKNELTAAREQYERFLKRNPTDAKVCHRLGIVCTKSGDPISATRYFTQAKQLDPTNSELLNDFGFALYQRGQYKAAEKLFSAALQNDANNNRIINNLALAVGHQGRFKESFSLFRNIMPVAESHANIAYIHTQRGEGELALKEYDLALSADPTLEKAGRAAAELAEMKNIIIAKREQNSSQELANTKAPTKTQPKQPKQQLARSKQSVQATPKRRSLQQSTPIKREKLISQASMEKKSEPERSKPTVSKPKSEPDALEINPFRTIDEINQEEKPVIIRISNEITTKETQKETFPKAPRQLR